MGMQLQVLTLHKTNVGHFIREFRVLCGVKFAFLVYVRLSWRIIMAVVFTQ